MSVWDSKWPVTHEKSASHLVWASLVLKIEMTLLLLRLSCWPKRGRAFFIRCKKRGVFFFHTLDVWTRRETIKHWLGSVWIMAPIAILNGRRPMTPGLRLSSPGRRWQTSLSFVCLGPVRSHVATITLWKASERVLLFRLRSAVKNLSKASKSSERRSAFHSRQRVRTSRSELQRRKRYQRGLRTAAEVIITWEKEPAGTWGWLFISSVVFCRQHRWAGAGFILLWTPTWRPLRLALSSRRIFEALFLSDGSPGSAGSSWYTLASSSLFQRAAWTLGLCLQRTLNGTCWLGAARF